MIADGYIVAGIFILIPFILLIPLWYAAYAYAPEKVVPLTRWKFAFVSLFLSYGVAVFIRVLLLPIDIVAVKFSHHIEIYGWPKTAALFQAFEFSPIVLLLILFAVGFVMPSRVVKFIATVRQQTIDS